MKRIALFFICIILQLLNADLCLAQNQHKIDSLLKVITTVKADTSRFYAYADVVREYSIARKFEDAKAYGDIALQMGNKLSGSKDINIDRTVRIGMAQAYLNIGSIYYYQHDLTSTDENYFKALPYVEGKDYNSPVEKKMSAKIFHNLGLSYIDEEKQDSALLFFLKSLQITEQMGDKRSIANDYLSIGLAYSRKSNFPKALEYYFKCLKILEEINDNGLLSLIYANIGMVYYNREDLADALNYFQKSLKIAKMDNDKLSLFTAYLNLGNTYTGLEDFPNGLNYYNKSLHIAYEIGDKVNMAIVLNDIGATYSEIYQLPDDSINALKKNLIFAGHGNIKSILLDSAIANHSRSLAICTDLNNNKGKMYNLQDIGRIYALKKNYDHAISFSRQAAELARQINDSTSLMNISKDLSDAYRQKGDYKNALIWEEKYFEIKDFVFSQEKEKEMGRQEQKYKSEKQIAILNKDKQIQNEEIKRQKLIKNSFIIALAVLLLLSILLYNYYRTRQLLKLQKLRNRIASDLHDDVGSTLSSISIFSELAKEQSKEVVPMLESIGDSSRKMLESMADIVWTINPENDNFEKIILRMRSFAYELLGAKKIDFEFNADDTVAKMKLSMDVRKNLYLIFKEATNNIVKYANADRAFFSINGTKNNLTMLIRDNGKGFDTNKLSEGNGLKNMKKRAQEIGAKLLIESGAGVGTTIQFILKTA
jgi:two-component system, NarL family, sensor histidine kinase UhpB